MSDGMGRELAYLSSHVTNRYFIPNWGIFIYIITTFMYFLGKILHIIRKTVVVLQ